MSIKKVPDHVAKRRLLRLADFLEKEVTNHQFDFSTFGNTLNRYTPNGTDALKDANLCGTSACALGWAPALPFARKLGFKLEVRSHGVPTFTRKGKPVSTNTVARDLFGLDHASWSYIFYPSVLNCGGGDDETRETVAEGIRKFCSIRFG